MRKVFVVLALIFCLVSASLAVAKGSHPIFGEEAESAENSSKIKEPLPTSGPFPESTKVEWCVFAQELQRVANFFVAQAQSDFVSRTRAVDVFPPGFLSLPPPYRLV